MRREPSDDYLLTILVPKEVEAKAISLVLGVALFEMAIEQPRAAGVANFVRIAFFAPAITGEGRVFGKAQLLAMAVEHCLFVEAAVPLHWDIGVA